MKGLALGLGVATLMVVGLACGAGKTPAGSAELDTGDGQTEIAQALQAGEGSEVTVSGHLIVDSDGNTRLCSVLAESGPPQCGGDRIELLGFDAGSVPNSKTPQRPSEIQTARWTDSYITVTGIKGRSGLAEVRLLDEPAADSTGVPVTSPASQAREAIPCFPTGPVARVGASVGDSWTLAGNIRLQGEIPGDPSELRDGPTESSVTFTLAGLDDGGRSWLVDEASGKRAHIENSEASVHITTVYRDDEGNTLEATDRDENWATFVFHGYDQALLTPDWDCHRNAWLTGGIPSSGDITRESSVGGIDLPTRSIVLFIETTAWDDPDGGDEYATKSVYGYDKVTGRLVLRERYRSGTFDGQPYTVDVVRELVPALNLSGINVAPAPTTSGMALTEDKFTDLMTIEDVETHLTAKVSLKAEFRNYKDLAGRADSSQVGNMNNWYGLTIEAADGGPGLTFSVIDFDSTSSAQTHLEETISETPGMRVMDSPIGDASFEIEVNAQGIGSMLVFIKGDKLVSLHTAQPEGEGPLLSLEGLEDLADLVASRL